MSKILRIEHCRECRYYEEGLDGTEYCEHPVYGDNSHEIDCLVLETNEVINGAVCKGIEWEDFDKDCPLSDD